MLDAADRQAPIHCLWLARGVPYPLTAGDRIYTCKLASALAEAGVAVVFMGLASTVAPTPVNGLTWHIVPDKQRSRIRSLFSRWPLVAARHATRGYAAQARELIRSRRWDAIVVDHYGSGWLKASLDAAPYRPVRVFIAHNHEASVTASQWRADTGSILKRLYLWQNWVKTSWLEKRVARSSDLITAITALDAEQFNHDAPGVSVLQLTPGYDGSRLETRVISDATPRSIVLFGSYIWSAKRASLTAFLDQADERLVKAGITVDVVGDMDQKLRRSLSGRYRAARFHGFVEDPAPFLSNARMAVLAEPMGGGFKLKLLEYIFNRVPVAALTACASGLPGQVCAHMLLAETIADLLPKVVSTIDNVDQLNCMHDGAYMASARLFDWRDRGLLLLEAIQSHRSGVLQASH